eukprot:5499263-Amphidinium_carterae.1
MSHIHTPESGKSHAHTPSNVRAPAASSAGELLAHLHARRLREAFPVFVRAWVRSIADLREAIRDGQPVIHAMAEQLNVQTNCDHVQLPSVPSQPQSLTQVCHRQGF